MKHTRRKQKGGCHGFECDIIKLFTKENINCTKIQMKLKYAIEFEKFRHKSNSIEKVIFSNWNLSVKFVREVCNQL